MQLNCSEPMIHVSRGPLTESVHRGFIAVTDTEGNVLYQLGDPDYITFARSAAKLLQALPVIESGAVDRYGLNEREISLLSASHSGEAEHVDTVHSILRKIGAAEDELQCGPHFPLNRDAASLIRERGGKPGRVHNNCSGKHSGMLAWSHHLGEATEHYMSPDHPVQQAMLGAVADMAGLAPSGVVLGTDGCGVPVFGMPLRRLAQAYARLGRPDGLPDERAAACRRVTAAVARHPFYLAGTDRFDTRLIEVSQGRILGKFGAEGVFALSVPDRGWGLALKVEDGAERALYPAVLEAVSQLGLLTASELAQLAAFRRPELRNWAGTQVGYITPAFRLEPRG
ncbi:asparaginase [Paenibacillus gansuensis]|uniref:Asparaginase n=1 Tax=Paenibacillus gansuensis TaxID=306542 RepID=A0ABW5PEL4_9BACL